MRQADPQQIGQFVSALFRYADENSFLSFRAFDQFDRGGKAVIIEAMQVGQDEGAVARRASDLAARAANFERPVVFAPPVATFRSSRSAATADLANGVAISVEIDKANPEIARRRLEHLLGPVTMAVHSGGEWEDPKTGELIPKVHLHWRLSEPTRAPEEHGRLREARYLAAILVGADTTAVPPAHPLRWPGSWNLKARPRLASIAAGNPASEVHLADALEKLQLAVESAGLRAADAPKASSDPQAPIVLVAEALAHVPNPDLEWDEWNRIGMAAWAATGGSADGLKAWADWSAQSKKHEEAACSARWAHFATSPPSRVGAGTIFFLAAQSGWVRPGRNDPPPEMPPEYWAGLDDRGETRTTERGGPAESPARKRDRYSDITPLPVTLFRDIAVRTDAQDFVEGLLVAGAMSVIYGESNSGKTFFATDLGLHVACGWPWNGREVERHGVIYCALEGAHGISQRVAAFRSSHGLDGQDIPFGVIAVPLNMLDPEADTGRLIATIKFQAEQLSIPIGLVFLDTLSRALAGGNENAPDDMGALVSNGDKIRTETGAHVAWVHHSGKDQAKGARGHSLLRAATDTEIEIASDGTQRSARVTKQRDLECSGEFTFTLKVIELGANHRGKPVTSCVVDYGEEGAPAPTRTGPKLTGDMQRAIEVLTDTLARAGETGRGAPPGVSSIPEKWWRDEFYDRAKPGADYEAKKKAFRRAADQLVERHMVGLANGRVWVVRQQPQVADSEGHSTGHFAGHNRDIGT